MNYICYVLAGHRIRHEVHGDLSQGEPQRGGGLLHSREGHQSQIREKPGMRNFVREYFRI